MPQGRLTPLGRQLRTVLASFCPCATASHQSLSVINRPSVCTTPSQHGSRSLYNSSTAQSAATVVASREDESGLSASAAIDDERYRRTCSWRRLNRRTYVDHITSALRQSDKQHLISRPPTAKRNLAHVNIKSRHWWHEYGTNRTRHASDVIWDSATSHELSIPRILATYVRHLNTVQGEELGESGRELSSREAQYLKAQGYDAEDISAWADIICADDSRHAIRLLTQRIDLRGSCGVPMLIYMRLLRRDYISAQALRALLQHFVAFVDAKFSSTDRPGPYMPSLFHAVVRFTRHARKVWPQAFASIVDLFIRHLERSRRSNADPNPHRTMASLSNATHWLNKIMSLISLRSAVLPFKDNAVQEAAIIRVLRFMANHDPPLHPNRTGYRAVIRLQLAQPKSSNDQLWAELKALSWPPWKVSRTAMDDEIGPEQGMSRAYQTLRQMQNAGYALLDWEKAVQAYAGWDADGTPTIQTRASVPGDTPRYTQGSAKWIARIETTRTVQEAWACFLAWDALCLPPNQDVYLAIFKMLLQEEKRRRSEHLRPHDSYEPALPGDGREIAPLPPSTHLYTYTRTPPPSVDDFCEQLKQRGVPFRAHLLAFLIANAGDFRTGIRRLEDSVSEYPEIRGLLSPDSPSDLSVIPIEVFSAAIKLFSRFAHLSPRGSLVPWGLNHVSKTPTGLFLDGQSLNRDHLIVRALELLRSRQTTFRPAWNAALEGLTREANFSHLRTAVIPEASRQDGGSDDDPSIYSDDLDKCGGAMVAYRLVRRTLTFYRELHMDLDITGFRCLCLATENLVVAAWGVLASDHHTHTSSSGMRDRRLIHYRKEAKALLHSNSHQERLKGEFRTLVGVEMKDNAAHPSDAPLTMVPDFPRLLITPNPALIHAYVRALGWLADYEGLCGLAQWMESYREELVEAMSRNRSGKAMLRRTLVAIRVFLERSWLKNNDFIDSFASEVSTGEDSSVTERGEKILRRLRNPANKEVVEHVRDIVESIEEWEGWPSDEEVDEYCRDARFAWVR